MWEYNYEYDSNTTEVSELMNELSELSAPALFLTVLFSLGLVAFLIVCNWKVFTKAKQEGWKSIIPIYNTIVKLEIVGLPLWYIVLTFIPFANIYVSIRTNIELAKKFGKSSGFAIGLILLNPIFMAMLAFDSQTQYVADGPQQFNNVGTQQPNVNGQMNQNMKFCGNCGTKLTQETSFCPNCGQPL